MDEQDRAVHEISDSRARLSELATELSRRVDKEHVKEFATEKASKLKQQAKDVASEKAAAMKDHAREAVMTKTTQMKERADSPKGWSLLGAIIGAGVGAALMRKAFTVREERAEERYEGDGPLYGREEYGRDVRGDIDRSDIASPARVSDTTQGLSMSGDVGFEGRGVQGKLSDVKERAYDLKERTVGRVREHVPDRDELKSRAHEMRGKATHWFDRTLDEQPMLFALGGIAVGMLASSMLPVTRRERRLIEPTKHRVEERISELGDRLTDKIRGESESVSADRAKQGEGMGATSASELNIGPGSTGISEAHTSAEMDRSQELSSPSGSRIPPLPPLDDMTKLH